jgi:hypothetical protein
MSVSSDRWSCPQCLPGSGTVVVSGSQADTLAAIKAVQQRHTEMHRKNTITLARLGLAESHPADSRRKSA